MCCVFHSRYTDRTRFITMSLSPSASSMHWASRSRSGVMRPPATASRTRPSAPEWARSMASGSSLTDEAPARAAASRSSPIEVEIAVDLLRLVVDDRLDGSDRLALPKGVEHVVLLVGEHSLEAPPRRRSAVSALRAARTASPARRRCHPPRLRLPALRSPLLGVFLLCAVPPSARNLANRLSTWATVAASGFGGRISSVIVSPLSQIPALGTTPRPVLHRSMTTRPRPTVRRACHSSSPNPSPVALPFAPKSGSAGIDAGPSWARSRRSRRERRRAEPPITLPTSAGMDERVEQLVAVVDQLVDLVTGHVSAAGQARRGRVAVGACLVEAICRPCSLATLISFSDSSALAATPPPISASSRGGGLLGCLAEHARRASSARARICPALSCACACAPSPRRAGATGRLVDLLGRCRLTLRPRDSSASSCCCTSCRCAICPATQRRELTHLLWIEPLRVVPEGSPRRSRPRTTDRGE